MLSVVIFKPLVFIWNALFRYLLTPLYKIYRLAKNRLVSNPNFSKNKFKFLITNKYVIHVVVIVIAITITASNINAQEIRQENYGKKSILYSLISSEEDEYITEEADTTTFAQGGDSRRGFLDTSANVIAQGNTLTDQSLSIDDSTSTMAFSQAIMPITSGSTIGDRDDVVYHVVQGGETISDIAKMYGISQSTLLWENKIGTKDYIKPGQKLTILPISGVSHKVSSGDTVEKIANKYKADTDKIIEYNQLADSSAISEDQVLIIPEGQIVAPPPIPTRTASTGSLTGYYDSTPAPAAASPNYGTKLQWPTTTTRISQYYSWRHKAIDLDGNTGDPIYAAESGTVSAIGWQGGYGLRIVVNHGGGMQTLYAHLSKTYVSAGQAVSRGETIGLEGNTGWSTGPHLHFEVIINGTKYNPLNYLR